VAKFSVGQRVKRIRLPADDPSAPHLGEAGTVSEIGWSPFEGGLALIWVLFDSGETWGCYEYTLVPLTPPAIHEWASEQVKKFTAPKFESPVVPKERVEQ